VTYWLFIGLEFNLCNGCKSGIGIRGEYSLQMKVCNVVYSLSSWRERRFTNTVFVQEIRWKSLRLMFGNWLSFGIKLSISSS